MFLLGWVIMSVQSKLPVHAGVSSLGIQSFGDHRFDDLSLSSFTKESADHFSFTSGGQNATNLSCASKVRNLALDRHHECWSQISHELVAPVISDAPTDAASASILSQQSGSASAVEAAASQMQGSAEADAAQMQGWLRIGGLDPSVANADLDIFAVALAQALPGLRTEQVVVTSVEPDMRRLNKANRCKLTAIAGKQHCGRFRMKASTRIGFQVEPDADLVSSVDEHLNQLADGGRSSRLFEAAVDGALAKSGVTLPENGWILVERISDPRDHRWETAVAVPCLFLVCALGTMLSRRL